MALVRPSNKVLDKLRAQEMSLRRNVARSKLFADGVKTKFWQEVERIQRERLHEVNTALDTELGKSPKMDMDVLIALQTTKTVLLSFLGITDFLGNQENMQIALDNKLKEIEEYEERIKKGI